MRFLGINLCDKVPYAKTIWKFKNDLAGEIPEEWTNPENRNKITQKDTDADWTNKNVETHFGYKNHVKCDADSKLITNYSVTNASVNDSQCCLFFYWRRR